MVTPLALVAHALTASLWAHTPNPQPAPSAPEPAQVAPASPLIQRVGGDMTAQIRTSSRRGVTVFTFGDAMRIDTPLPVGYPDPTPPGAIDIKTYPLVRRAEVTSSINPEVGRNGAFWPLFRHIQSRNIEMTSPVEMDYPGATKDTPPSTWTMSFLYRFPDQAPTGKDGSVSVVDVEPMTVVALGYQGSYSTARFQINLARLEEWLANNPAWVKAGEPRAMYYNGPEARPANRWAEVQIPIKPAAPAPVPAPAPAPAAE